MTHGDTASRALLPFRHAPQASWSGGTVAILGIGTLGLLTRHSWAHLFRNDLVRATFLLIQVGLQRDSFSLPSSWRFCVLTWLELCNIRMLSTRPAGSEEPMCAQELPLKQE